MAEGKEPITNKMVAERLNLDGSATSRRVNRALNDGYLVNEEENKRKPKKLKPGEPLPENQDILPMVEELEACRVVTDLVDDEPPTVILPANGRNGKNGKLTGETIEMDLERIEERAAIIEFEGGVERGEAERLAMLGDKLKN